MACSLSSLLWQTQAYCKGSTERSFNCANLNRRIVRPDGTVHILYCPREITKGAVLRLEDLEFTQIPESKCPTDAIDDETTAEGRTVKVTIRKGSPIRLRDLGVTVVPGCQSRVEYLGKENIPLPVLHAATKICKGHVIRYEDLVLRSVLFNKIPPHALVSPYSAVGRKAAKDVTKGRILFSWDVGLGD